MQSFTRGNNSCGIFNGRESDTFAPNDYITREALAAVLYRYILDYKNAHLRVTVGALNGYTDNNEISDSFRDAMIWAVSDGIITGVSATRLDPKGYVTRAIPPPHGPMPGSTSASACKHKKQTGLMLTVSDR